MLDKINKHFKNLDLDIRKTRSCNFVGSKITPDVLSAISECIIEFIKTAGSNGVAFTKIDISYSKYAKEFIINIFSNPNPKKSQKEYDEFFSQTLNLLVYAEILKVKKKKGTNFYTVVNFEILKYISMLEKSALNFLFIYLTKILTDSKLIYCFKYFLLEQNKQSLDIVRIKFKESFKKNILIKNNYELSNIFNIIINILAFKKRVKGTVRGTISKTSLSLENIRYNKINWRDIGKNKQKTRDEFRATLDGNPANKNFYKYCIQKAKRFVNEIHPYSEIHRFAKYPGLHTHHIFMESEYPEIADYPENIICLTPNQHFLKAHPNNKTSIIDEKYLLICLISKLDSIEFNYRNSKNDYSLEDFTRVLNVGMNTDFFKPEMDFEEIKYQILKKEWLNK